MVPLFRAAGSRRPTANILSLKFLSFKLAGEIF